MIPTYQESKYAQKKTVHDGQDVNKENNARIIL